MLGLLKRPGRLRVSDTCTRADDALNLGSTETGQVYTALAGTWGVSGSKAYLVSSTQQAVVVAEAGTPDMSVSADITLSPTANRADAGLVVRVIDISNYLLANIAKASGDTVKLWKRDGGTFTLLADLTAAGNLNGSTYRFKVVCSGNSITIYRDGVQKLAHTLTGGDATKFGSPTLTGLRVHVAGTNDDGGTRFDNLLVERLL